MAEKPQPQPVHAKSFVAETYDKFEDKRTTRLALPASLNNAFYSNFKTWTENEIKHYSGFTFYLTYRHVKTPDVDALVLDYNYEGEDWGWVRDGKLIINIDGTTNITLTPVETDTSTGFSYYNGVNEVGYYNITPEELSTICNANSLEIKITGQKFSFTLDNSIKQIIGGLTFPEKFLFMSRAFFSGLYSDDSYLPHLQKVVETSTVTAANLKKQGCMKTVIGVIVFIILLFLFFALSK
jgi:hypothetical protein